jgi:hypothetical protein
MRAQKTVLKWAVTYGLSPKHRRLYLKRILNLLLPSLYFVSSSYLLGPEIQFFGNKLEKLGLRKWKEVHNLIDSTKKFISSEMSFQDWLHNIFFEIPRDGDILWCSTCIFMEQR